MPRKPLHVITDLRVWRVLCAPVRMEIIETMRMLGPCGIADVARQLDRPADTLYRHVRKLVACGVLVEAGSRPAGTRTERVYDIVADDIATRYRNADPHALSETYLTTAESILKITSRTFRRAAAAGELIGSVPGRKRTTRLFFEHVWLTPDDATALDEKLVELVRFLGTKKTRREDTRLQLVSVLTAPIVRRRGARPAAASRATETSRAGTRRRRAGRSTTRPTRSRRATP